MDEDMVQLINMLCTRAGMIMEDASPIAIILTKPGDVDALRAKLAVLAKAAAQVDALVTAACMIADV